ncbi:unnamed protein product [Lupinus luteus]|uniref:Nucleoporin Nup54 alpha-helical domain-containing protein n=1 Tax=Lupinus luteus TaxID=3873 RepID=A0AAV1XTN8_LUPLU
MLRFNIYASICINCIKSSNAPSNLNQTQNSINSSFIHHITMFGSSSSAFRTPPFGSSLFNTPFSSHQQPFTKMANLAPAPLSSVDRDVQAIVDSYKDDPVNTENAFQHLLFSVTEPQFKVKPVGVSDIMWSEAMRKLEGMKNADRERLWPQLVQGFKDLSRRIEIQDEVIVSDTERLRITQSNVKMLQRHFQADTLPRIQRMKQKEQTLKQRLLKVMRIVEAFEGKGCSIPLTKAEAELAEKLATITRQLRGTGADLSTRVQNLLSVSHVQTSGIGFGGSVYLPGSTKIHEQSLADLQGVLQKQTGAIARLNNVLKRDIRNMEITVAETKGATEKGNST